MADRLTDALESLVRRVVGARLDYLAAYPARAVAQNADGTLELVPDDKRLPTFKNVGIRYGVPGVSATIAAGARVLLEFAGGDPRSPIATVWESASVTQLVVTSSAIKLGGSGATEKMVLGTSYSTHMTAAQTAATALSAAITPLMLPPAVGAAKAALQQLITALGNLAADVSSQNTTL
jgi:hypothetical protein